MLKASTAVVLLCLSAICLHAQANKKPLPLHIRVANAAETVGVLDLSIATQIELDVTAGRIAPELKDAMLESAKQMYNSSHETREYARTIRDRPEAYHALIDSDTSQEMRLSIIRVLNSEMPVIRNGKTIESAKLHQMRIKAFNARKELINLMLTL
jgi:hypothetical protein